MKKLSEHKSGFISLVGRPNVGKSTLLNQLLGQKLAIVSPKPQTTRNKVLGIKTIPSAQMVFVDTPGIFKPRSQLDRRMVRTTYTSLQEVDLVLWLVEAKLNALSDEGLLKIANTLKTLKVPKFLLINKVDLMPEKRQLLPLMEKLSGLAEFAQIIPVCALDAESVATLLEQIPPYLPPGPCYFPEDMLTDQPERFLLAEIIREKVYTFTHQEIPYSTAVAVESMEDDIEKNLVRVEAVIYIERDSQKGIVVGKGGRSIKKIGMLARREIEHLLGTKVFLNLWVKVRKDWRQQDSFLDKMGH